MSKAIAESSNITNNMEISVEDSLLADVKGTDSRQQDQLDHQFSLLQKNITQTWWLKVSLVLLYFPAIVLLVLSYLQWSGAQNPTPRQQDTYPDMMISMSNILNRRQKTYLIIYFKHRLCDRMRLSMRFEGSLKTTTIACTQVIQVQNWTWHGIIFSKVDGLRAFQENSLIRL